MIKINLICIEQHFR